MTEGHKVPQVPQYLARARAYETRLNEIDPFFRQNTSLFLIPQTLNQESLLLLSIIFTLPFVLFDLIVQLLNFGFLPRVK